MEPNTGDLLTVPKTRSGHLRHQCNTAPTIIDHEHARRLLRWHDGHGGTGMCEPYLAATAYVLADESWCYE